MDHLDGLLNFSTALPDGYLDPLPGHSSPNEYVTESMKYRASELYVKSDYSGTKLVTFAKNLEGKGIIEPPDSRITCRCESH
jgi:hypothetical protein